MPTWGGILRELQAEGKKMKPKLPFDKVRRKYLKQLHEHTERNVILYAANWTQPKNYPPGFTNITFEDVQGFMEVVSGLSGPSLDLIIHSPGGQAEATEMIVVYLRSKFKHIRAIIPHGAMSAATMLTCAADEIIMGKHSFLSPIDPQMRIRQRYGEISVPGQAVTEQFDKAKIDCRDPKHLGVWVPMLEQYGPALLIQCEHATKLSKLLVSDWLKKYMFKRSRKRAEKAKKISEYLSDRSNFMSHGRPIGLKKAKSIGLKVSDLETDQTLQDLVLSIFHATTHTFDATNAAKIIENHAGKAFIKKHTVLSRPRQVQVPIQLPIQPPGQIPAKPK